MSKFLKEVKIKVAEGIVEIVNHTRDCQPFTACQSSTILQLELIYDFYRPTTHSTFLNQVQLELATMAFVSFAKIVDVLLRPIVPAASSPLGGLPKPGAPCEWLPLLAHRSTCYQASSLSSESVFDQRYDQLLFDSGDHYRQPHLYRPNLVRVNVAI